MKCAVCQTEGLQSRVFPGMSTMTAMYCQPFYDEGGEYHHHDMNSTSTSYTCSNGHAWNVVSRPRCPAQGCGWNGDTPVENLT